MDETTAEVDNTTVSVSGAETSSTGKSDKPDNVDDYSNRESSSAGERGHSQSDFYL